MRYVGPPSLKKTVKEEYERVRADYPRTDIEDPIFVVGPMESVVIRRGQGRAVQGADAGHFNGLEENENTPEFMALFRYFVDRVRTGPARAAIQSTKEAIEESWATNRKVLEVLGIAT